MFTVKPIWDLQPQDWIVFRDAARNLQAGKFLRAERDRHGWDVLWQPKGEQPRWTGFHRLAQVKVERRDDES